MHFYGIILVHLATMLYLKQLSDSWILNLKKSQIGSTYCLTTFAHLEAKLSIVQPQFLAQQAHQWDVLFGFQQLQGLYALLFLLSSIRVFIFMQQNHIDLLKFQSKFSMSRHHNINYCASATGQAQRYNTLSSKKLAEVGVAACIIYSAWWQPFTQLYAHFLFSINPNFNLNIILQLLLVNMF